MKPIRVLVVDDSAFARKVLRELLSQDPELTVVGVARDGAEALEKIADLKPDVITLDLIMPDVDGLAVLRALPPQGAPRVIVVSITAAEAELAIEALEQGAIDLVTKPTALATDRLYDIGPELRAKVKLAASAHPHPRAGELTTPRLRPPSAPKRAAGEPSTPRLVVIGTSTGGPQALTQLFAALPAEFPVPIAVALHIPAGYTAPLAARISQVSALRMEEARHGMTLEPGRAVIAPGGQHLRIYADGPYLRAAVSSSPTDALHRPSIDELFKSAAQAVGRHALAVVLTGMGDDGLLGAKAIYEAGGRVLAESASSCVVYGMPRTVIEAGVASAEAPLASMPALLLSALTGDISTTPS